MSASEPSSHHGASAPVVDVLLVFDTSMLLARHPDASLRAEAPTLTDADGCYLLAPAVDELTARNDGRLRIVAPVGAHVRLRSSTLAMRAEHLAVVSGFHPADEDVLSDARLVIKDDVELTVPPSSENGAFVRRPAIDYYWQSRVRAHGTVDAQLDAILTDRAGETIGCFRWSIVVDVTAP
ncbi:inclusion body family protein [Ralstonia insidiosa]|jgi:hypothetical protein|uniref:Inclusion body protein n=1 Tax=Ralstonia insidiosa TaxID=190721 RepID=A0A191ZT72_9RALS|nr:AidA/PixA family protein [Ralstonia insidiosa]ANJ71325.1 hypothetical protein A9Y76_01975 [Ralstonia insidiosa]MBY4908524.1 inclusion body family protein [Ralstonia insidiosa]